MTGKKEKKFGNQALDLEVTFLCIFHQIIKF